MGEKPATNVEQIVNFAQSAIIRGITDHGVKNANPTQRKSGGLVCRRFEKMPYFVGNRLPA